MQTVTVLELKKLLTQSLGEDVVNNWFMHFGVSVQDEKVHLFFPSDFIKDWINTHYIDELEASLKIIMQAKHIMLCLETQKPEMIKTEEDHNHTKHENKTYFQHTFDNFVIGRSNEMAYTAALKTCENLHSKPILTLFFIYGEPGVGKSHLLSAINAKVHMIDPTMNISYITAEQFMIRFITALKENNIIKFKEELRLSKFFLIDDVQFMMGKESTQEEFFHTFNYLIEKQCQIVLSSDKAPSQLEGLEDRLRSRLGGGLTIQIHNPTYELRLSILNTKMKESNLTIDNSVLHFLAENINGTLRDLEGAWTQLLTHSTWMNVPITMDLVYQVLQNSLSTYEKKITIKDIQCAAGNFYGFPLNDILADKREKKLTRTRHVAMFLCRQLTTSSSSEIGLAFGGKDHTSILYAVEKIDKERKKDFNLANEIDIITKQLKNIFNY